MNQPLASITTNSILQSRDTETKCHSLAEVGLEKTRDEIEEWMEGELHEKDVCQILLHLHRFSKRNKCLVSNW